MINKQPIAIFIDSRASHNYIDPNLVERFHLARNKHNHSWMVWLDTGTKRKISESVKSCPLNMNRLNKFLDLNIIPLGSYDILIGMDWLDTHNSILYFYNNIFTCIDEEGK